MAEKKPTKPRKRTSKGQFSIPKKGERCVRFTKNFAGRGTTTKDQFHKDSFRWKEEPNAGKGKAFVMVGCPLRTRSKRGAPLKSTRWDPSAPIGSQCRYSTGGKAGLRGHKIIQSRSGGSCRTGYTAE
jgi:hypothetical protein